MKIAIMQVETSGVHAERVRSVKERLESCGHEVEWYYYEDICDKGLKCEIEDLIGFVDEILVYGIAPDEIDVYGIVKSLGNKAVKVI